MPIPRPEWEYLYQTSTATQLPWELGGPDPCLVRAIERKLLPGRGRVVDLGCGLGSAAVYLAALGCQVTGVDLSATAIEKAKDKARQAGVTVDFRVSDALATGLTAKSCDVVYDRGCLQHLSRERWPDYRKEVVRLLKVRGRYTVEVQQDQVSLDDLTALLGPGFTRLVAQGATHVERPTGIPRYHTFAVFRWGMKR